MPATRYGWMMAVLSLTGMVSAGCGGPDPTCHYSLSTEGHGVSATGGNLEIKVEAPTGCPWLFQGNDPWVSVHAAPPAPSGAGDGTIIATIAANAGTRRVGSATVGHQRVTIDQAGTNGAGTCSFRFFPVSATIGPSGGLGAFAIVPNADDCGWWVEARSPDDDWIDGDFHRGIGRGIATYQVAPGATLPSVPLPRMGRIGIHDSTNAFVGDHMITETP